jgi:hypothetical protein
MFVNLLGPVRASINDAVVPFRDNPLSLEHTEVLAQFVLKLLVAMGV